MGMTKKAMVEECEAKCLSADTKISAYLFEETRVVGLTGVLNPGMGVRITH